MESAPMSGWRPLQATFSAQRVVSKNNRDFSVHPQSKTKKPSLVHKDDWHIMEPRRVNILEPKLFSKFKVIRRWPVLERKTRLELATLTLARLCSTNWAISANFLICCSVFQGAIGVISVLRVQRYCFFLNHQTFLEKKCEKSWFFFKIPQNRPFYGAKSG